MATVVYKHKITQFYLICKVLLFNLINYNQMLTSPKQIKVARILLDWTQKDLADKSDVSLDTIRRLEQDRGFVKANSDTLRKISKTMESSGIQFISELGVKFKEGFKSLP